MGKNLKGKECGDRICRRMDADYAGSTIRQTYTAVGTMFRSAVMSGMQPKVLQKLLGHAGIRTAMDRCVHVTDESLAAGVRQFGQQRQMIVP